MRTDLLLFVSSIRIYVSVHIEHKPKLIIFWHCNQMEHACIYPHARTEMGIQINAVLNPAVN